MFFDQVFWVEFWNFDYQCPSKSQHTNIKLIANAKESRTVDINVMLEKLCDGARSFH